MNSCKIGMLAGLTLHFVLYSYLVHPMATVTSDTEGIGRLVYSMIVYFPASLLALGVAMLFRATEAFTYATLILGGAWYGAIGYFIGRYYDKHSRMT